MSDHPKIHHKRRRSQLLAYGQHLLYGLTSQQHLFAGRFLLPAVVQPGTSRIDQSRTGNHSPLGGSGCSSLWTTSRNCVVIIWLWSLSLSSWKLLEIRKKQLKTVLSFKG
ncbi:uncharacterized protein LOC107861899 isoform X2 [Capsicum annuum]|uniref:uncharacterized protein LOC107861899 isoform X2 n=1 Tax=Capsicum annuum TaxID=4072 RepID=UPI001FB15E8B|nr:uncharacterized protein LOC107861899 isoform X2 [Capsicum annuum]XP_047266043.1 uncharacterized protein LOC107861899 isoform X2 [Capsicum annuum]